MTGAAALVALSLLLVVAVPSRLARSHWPLRAPSYALLLWQALGLAGGVLAIELLLTVALAPLGPTHAQAFADLLAGEGAPWWSVLFLFLAATLFLRLLSVLLLSTARTLGSRRSHRVLLDLVATRNPLLPRARVVDHEVPVAYCLPGLRSRVVLSRGVVALLRDDELHAVLAHETAHVEQRHDLVVLPFVALGSTFPRLPPVRTALAEVALLIEMLADDRAARAHPRTVLARSLRKVGTGQRGPGSGGDAGDSAIADSGLLRRAGRLLQPPASLGAPARVAVVAAATGVLLLPLLALLVPTL